MKKLIWLTAFLVVSVTVAAFGSLGGNTACFDWMCGFSTPTVAR